MKYSSMKISVVSALGLGLALAVVWLVCGWPTPVAGADVGQVEVLASQVRYVAPSGVNKGDCNVPDSACQTVQYAMDRATEGDEIRVAAGTYTDIHTAVLESWRVITQVVYIRKSVSIQGGYTTANWEEPSPATNLTVLDAGGQGRVFYVDEDAQPTIEGLCITGGDATGLGGGPVGEEDVGGGIYVTADNVAIRNNQVFGNSAVYGGGVYVGYGAVTISGNTVTSNTAQQGGGVYLDESNSPVTGNTFVSNHADYGGGLFLSKSGATLGYNTVVSNAAGIRGGGLLLWRSDAAELNGNTVMSNTADYGGGVYMDESSATLVNNVVADNQAMTAGSGVYISGSDPNLLHTTIARNSGGDGSGVHVAEYVAEGGSVTLSDVEMAHTILVGHEGYHAVGEWRLGQHRRHGRRRPGHHWPDQLLGGS
jgi:hypothetical protein